MAKTKVRLFGQLGAQFDNLQKAIDLDSASLINIATDAGIDSAEAIALIDSSYVGVRSSLSYNDISSKPTTLSGYGITDADSDQQVDSDRDAVISDLRNSVSSSLDTLQEIAASINNDSDFSTTIDNVFYRKTYQGLNYGYYAGGSPWPSALNPTIGSIGGNNSIEKYSFNSSAEEIDVGDLTVGRVNGTHGGHSSESYGYVSGGQRAVTDPTNPYAPYSHSMADGVDAIDKWSFTSDGNATDVGDLAQDKFGHGSHSSIWNAKGYLSGGSGSLSWATPQAPVTTSIQSFPFASDAGSTVETATLDVGRGGTNHGGNSSNSYGYTQGGHAPLASFPGPSGYYYRRSISKFPFASDATANDVGDGIKRYKTMGSASSQTHGYTFAGVGHESTPAPAVPISINYKMIEKFPFVSDSYATDVGDLSIEMFNTTGNSGITHGFKVHGQRSTPPDSGAQRTVEKFSFASDGNAVDHCDLSVGGSLRTSGHGQNY